MSQTILTKQTTPTTPASNNLSVFASTTTGRLATVDDAGNVINYVPVESMKGRLFLPFGVNDQINPVTGSGSGNSYVATVDRTMALIKFAIACAVLTTNSGSHYWIIKLIKLDGTQLATFNTSAEAPNVNILLSTTTFSPSSVGASDKGVIVQATKSGTPGNLYLWGPALEVEI